MVLFQDIYATCFYVYSFSSGSFQSREPFITDSFLLLQLFFGRLLKLKIQQLAYCSGMYQLMRRRVVHSLASCDTARHPVTQAQRQLGRDPALCDSQETWIGHCASQLQQVSLSFQLYPVSNGQCQAGPRNLWGMGAEKPPGSTCCELSLHPYCPHSVANNKFMSKPCGTSVKKMQAGEADKMKHKVLKLTNLFKELKQSHRDMPSTRQW